MMALFLRPPKMFRPGRFTVGLLLAALLSGTTGLLPPAPAFAQNTQKLVDKVDRLQRELQTLQRAVFRGEQPPAPEVTRNDSQFTPTQAARIEVRLSQFEAELRSLTGQLEEMRFALDRATDRLDKLVADVDRRLLQLESGGSFGAGAVPQGDEANVGQAGGDTGTTGTIGTISQSDLEAAQNQLSGDTNQGATQTAAVSAQSYELPGETPDAKYSYAFSLLRQANYEEAEVALTAFVLQFGDNPLAGNAQYWLGETYYVQGQYQQAAVTFAEAYQNYPDSDKAPDNLLKLGISLAALGANDDACGTYGELLQRYPNAASTIRQRATQEHQRLGCQ
jgi:tol-pal system protein YbgF